MRSTSVGDEYDTQSSLAYDGGSTGAATTSTRDARLANLAKHYEKFQQHLDLLTDSPDGMIIEYQHLALLERKDQPELARMTREMMLKNRYLDIIPVEATRIILGSPSSAHKNANTYINANYIAGCSAGSYIAAQGPLPNTIVDFWLMVWLQSASIIVMLTNLVERGIEKCHTYWPELGDDAVVGPFTVTHYEEDRKEDYTIRKFKMVHTESGTERQVIQLHYTNWPDQGVPAPDSFAHCVLAVDDHMAELPPGPLLVHCSAGVGRTGVFIAAHHIVRHFHKYIEEGVSSMPFLLDVKGTVRLMRKSRPFMIQTAEQYAFTYRYVQSRVEQLLADNNIIVGATTTAASTASTTSTSALSTD